MMNGLAYGGAAVFASSLDMRVGCEDTQVPFSGGRLWPDQRTWTLPNQVGWPIAKELLFTARIVEAEEAYRIGLLNHLVPREQLRDKTMELARMIAGNHRGAVMGVKALLMKQKRQSVEEQWAEERHYTTERHARRQGRGRLPRIHRPQGQSPRLNRAERRWSHAEAPP